MRQLSKIQSIIMLVGAFLMVTGAGLYVVGIQTFSPPMFALGAVAFAVMQLQQTYDGHNITVKRLRRIMTVSNILFMLAAVFMLEDSYRFILPFFLNYIPNGYYHYVTYIHNNWVLLLLVAAILEIYTTHRISNELRKEQDTL